VFFRQVLHEDLGCASYVIADGGEAVVVDPKWDVDDYLRLGLRFVHALETHTHADHVSGRARLGLDEPWGGEELRVGQVTIKTLPSPGHRPEHRSFLVDDWALLTGDSLFVGDVARPDLAVEAEDGARDLHASVQRLLGLRDDVEVWPGHIGGSLCGGAGMSEKPSSTIGRERRANALAGIEDVEVFVHRLTSSLAPQPPNFRRIVELNRDGPPSEAASLDPVPASALPQGALILDGREPREFDARHIPGALNVSTAFHGVGTRAAWVVEPDADVFVTDASMVRLLEAVGIRDVQVLSFETWTGPWESTPAVDPAGVDLARMELLDVREQSEWEQGHVDGSLHVPYHELRNGLPELPRDRPLAVICSAGNRSSLAASLLRRRGFDNVVHVADGGVEDLLGR
jgi:rhodanese-related sulfurtransferase/glyoxylase-like metal-dependent hydrolase (beta-lactamase superfamily II)